MTDDADFAYLMERYGYLDYVVWVDHYKHYMRFRGYREGGWLEGYQSDFVIYWGA